MSDSKKEDQLALPKVTDFSVADELTKPWDVVQSSLRDQTFIIIDYKQVEAFGDPGYVAKCLINEKEVNVLFNGEVLMKTLEQIQEHFPVKATLVKENNYYEFK